MSSHVLTSKLMFVRSPCACVCFVEISVVSCWLTNVIVMRQWPPRPRTICVARLLQVGQRSVVNTADVVNMRWHSDTCGRETPPRWFHSTWQCTTTQCKSHGSFAGLFVVIGFLLLMICAVFFVLPMMLVLACILTLWWRCCVLAALPLISVACRLAMPARWQESGGARKRSYGGGSSSPHMEVSSLLPSVCLSLTLYN